MKRRNRLETLFSERLVAGKSVVAAVSGGADSTAMLHRLLALREQRVISSLAAVHINHQLRGEESLRDEQFVRSLCGQWDVPLTVAHIDVRALAQENRQSVEEAGREARYRLLEQVRQSLPQPAVIATAHTLSDHFETGLLHLVRGSGLHGLCGIHETRGDVVRPMLSVSREQVEDYCLRMGLSYVEDSSNRDFCYARNRVRLAVVPQLREINPAAAQSYLRLTKSLREDEDYLLCEARRQYEAARCGDRLRLEPLHTLHPAIAGRVCALYLGERGFSADYRLLQAVRQLAFSGSGTQNLPGGEAVTAAGGFLSIRQKTTEIPYFCWTLTENEPLSVQLPGKPEPVTLLLRKIPVKDGNWQKKIYKNLLIFAADYDTIIGNLVIRQRLPGDRMALPARGISKPVRRIFSEEKLPLSQRQTSLIAADDRGVVWAQHIGNDRRTALTEKTKQVLLLTAEPAKKETDSDDGAIY